MSPCELADGDLKEHHDLSLCPVGCGRGSVTAAAIDLGRIRQLSLVVARGCFFCALHTSTNGRDWRLLDRPFQNLNEDIDVAVVPASGHRARYVRIRESGGLSDPKELSVW